MSISANAGGLEVAQPGVSVVPVKGSVDASAFLLSFHFHHRAASVCFYASWISNVLAPWLAVGV